MYRALNLKICKTDLMQNWEVYYDMGKSIWNEQKNVIQKTVDGFIENEVIDGIKLKDEWFKTCKSHIFLSHSHNDKELAIAFSGFLWKEFNLKAFVDGEVWKSADKLLKVVDDKYCKNEYDNNYNYTKRNYSTSHIHAILTSAIMESINATELVIFLNTDESVPIIEDSIGEIEEYTISPWIYEELMIVEHINIRDWKEYRKEFLLEFAKGDYRQDQLTVKYRIPKSRLESIEWDDICKWLTCWQMKMSRLSISNENALNCLYESYFGLQ